MSIQQAMHRYHEGLDKQDNRLMASAFGEDGTVTMVVDGRDIVTVKKEQIALTGIAPPLERRRGAVQDCR